MAAALQKLVFRCGTASMAARTWLGRLDAAQIRRAFHNMSVDESRFFGKLLAVCTTGANEPGALTEMLNWYRATMRYDAGLLKPRVSRYRLVSSGAKKIALWD